MTDTRWCSVHNANVRTQDAEVIRSTETGSGPGHPVYACITCIRARGLLTVRPSFIGRRDGSPTAPGRPA